MKPFSNGTKLINRIKLIDSSCLKNEDNKGELKNINNDIIMPRVMEITQAVFKYLFILPVFWIKKTFIPVSVNISVKAKVKEAIPYNPN